jgi:hypothetical protein
VLWKVKGVINIYNNLWLGLGTTRLGGERYSPGVQVFGESGSLYPYLDPSKNPSKTHGYTLTPAWARVSDWINENELRANIKDSDVGESNGIMEMQ